MMSVHGPKLNRYRGYDISRLKYLWAIKFFDSKKAVDVLVLKKPTQNMQYSPQLLSSHLSKMGSYSNS